jgi:hypothetical protein
MTSRLDSGIFSGRRELSAQRPGKEEWGYVINPKHSDVRAITVSEGEPFSFDLRLIR